MAAGRSSFRSKLDSPLCMCGALTVFLCDSKYSEYGLYLVPCSQSRIKIKIYIRLWWRLDLLSQNHHFPSVQNLHDPLVTSRASVPSLSSKKLLKIVTSRAHVLLELPLSHFVCGASGLPSTQKIKISVLKGHVLFRKRWSTGPCVVLLPLSSVQKIKRSEL